jgi:uncharacterized protein (DUF433 family)
MSASNGLAAGAWTTAEAAFIVGEPLASFKKVVERSPVKPAIARRGRISVRCFALRDLVFLSAYRDLQKDFTNDGRTRIYDALLRLADPAPNRVEAGDIAFNFHRHLAVVEAKVRSLETYENQIDTARGEAVIKGTSIEVHRLAALFDGGMTAEEIEADYPSLNREQVLAALAWAVSHPKPGRPFPKRTAKAAMRDVDLSALDEFLGLNE